MAFGSGAKAKILHLGERIATNRVGIALHLDQVDFSAEQLRKTAAQSLLTLAMVTGVTGVLFAVGEFVDLRHEIVFYFIPILIAMLRWNVLQGFIAAVAAALFANFFFYEFILNFYFSNPKRIVGLGFFVVALVIIGYLASNLRHARRASSVPLIPFRQALEPEAPAAAIAAPIELVPPKTDAIPLLARTPTVPERVKDFLATREGEMFCDSCIQANLGLKWRQQVQLITATLGVTRDFKRDQAQCSGCDEVKQATQAVSS
jgi:hypothetical protein